MEPIKSLESAHIAIVALGNSQVDYAIGRENGVEWDEGLDDKLCCCGLQIRSNVHVRPS